MIAVGVGIAPMIHTLRALFRHRDLQLRIEKNRSDQNGNNCGESAAQAPLKVTVKLLYGVVRSQQILLIQII